MTQSNGDGELRSPREEEPLWEEELTGGGYSLDELAKGMASGTISRGRALKLVGTAFLGGALSFLSFTDVAEARLRRRRRRRGPRCPASGTGCDVQCVNTNKDCACVRTVEGVRVCVHPCCPPPERNGVPTSCTSSFGTRCRADEVCMRTDCCDENNLEGVCVRLCAAERPGYCPGGTTITEATSTPPVWNALNGE